MLWQGKELSSSVLVLKHHPFLPRYSVKNEICHPSVCWLSRSTWHWRMGRWDLGLIAIVRPNSVLTPNEKLEPNTCESVLTSQRESPLARFVPLSAILVVPLWLFALLLPSGKLGLKAAELYVVKYMYPLDKYSLLHPDWPSPGHQMNRQTQLLSWNLLSWKCTSVMISL